MNPGQVGQQACEENFRAMGYCSKTRSKPVEKAGLQERKALEEGVFELDLEGG